MIQISLDEYKALLRLEARVELLHEAYMEDGYVFQKDVQKIFGWAPVEKEDKHE